MIMNKSSSFPSSTNSTDFHRRFPAPNTAIRLLLVLFLWSVMVCKMSGMITNVFQPNYETTTTYYYNNNERSLLLQQQQQEEEQVEEEEEPSITLRLQEEEEEEESNASTLQEEEESVEEAGSSTHRHQTTPYLPPVLRSVSQTPQWKEHCKDRSSAGKGIIISNQVGYMGNNFFEISMANRLATELCWDVIYRPYWGSFFPTKKDAARCFPNAMLSNTIPYSNPQLLRDLHISESVWDDLNWPQQLDSTNDKQGGRRGGRLYNERLESWIDSQNFTSTQVWKCNHPYCDFTGNTINNLIQDIQSGKTSYKILWLNAFFIHYDWINDQYGTAINDASEGGSQKKRTSDLIPQMRRWLQIDEQSCCPTPSPPSNAVVIHVRDFNPQDAKMNRNNTYKMYMDLLRQYNYLNGNHPIWIVCQPSSVSKSLVQDLKNEILAATGSTDVQIHVGQDHIDAWCILSRAQILIIDTSSTFSQSAALVGDTNTASQQQRQIHYPTHTLMKPKVTLKVPEWKYHLINQTNVLEYDVNHDRLTVKLA